MAIISLDMQLIGSYLIAQSNLRTGTAVNSLLLGPPQAPIRGPAVITPWEILDGDKSLSSRIVGLRGRDKFIDLKAESVVRSRGDEDSKKLFALFNALNMLKTIAEYGASELATGGLYKSLNTTLQRGLTEIREFLRNTTYLKPVDLLYGTKKDHVISQAALGKAKANYIGAVIQAGERDDPIASLTGTEKFTITLTSGVETDDFVIDLSLMTGPLSISNIGKFINDTISALTIVDAESNVVSKYNTRFNTETVSEGQFAFKIKTAAGETVTLSAADVTPSLVLTGTKQIPGAGNTETSFVSKLDDLSSADPTFSFSREIAGTPNGEEATVITIEETGKEIITEPVAETEARAVVTDSDGNIYVVGGTVGDIDSNFNRSDGRDVFLEKFDASGSLIFRRLLGAEAEAEGFAITLDSANNIIISGKSTANLTTTSIVDNPDSFVTKFDNDGNELFTYQVQSGSTDGALAVTVDSNDDILIAGFVDGRLDTNQTASGGRDAYLTKLDGTDGTVISTHQFGTAGSDIATGIAIAADGNILVASTENGHAVLRKFDATTPSTEIFSVDLGNLNGGQVTGIAVDGASVYLTGYTSNGALAGSIVDGHSGGTDGFVSRIVDSGASAAVDFTTYVGSAGDDRIRAIAVNGGKVYIAGHTDGSLPGGTLTGAMDAFVVKIDGTSGARDFVKQFGAASSNFDVNGISFAAEGSSSLTALGLPTGKVELTINRSVLRQTTVREGDQFFITIGDGFKRTITIEKNETFISLANKIKRLSFINITARSSFGKNGPQLRIEALRGTTIDIFAGPEGKDALKGLGITPGRLFDELNETDEDSKVEFKVGGIFGLELDRNLLLNSKKSSEFAFGALDLAIGIVQKAFRSLTFDPAKERLKALLASKKSGFGPPPAYLASRLANFQDALLRLGGTPTNFGLF